jgi:hypothetical protein
MIPVRMGFSNKIFFLLKGKMAWLTILINEKKEIGNHNRNTYLSSSPFSK